MPQYLDPKVNQGQIKYATIGRNVYGFGYTNNTTYPKGPVSPAAPTLTTFPNAAATINSSNVNVKLVYVYPGSTPAQVNPATMPMGFASPVSNIAVSSGSQINIASPGYGSDNANLVIGYNVFAGSTAATCNLVNTDAIVPISDNYVLSIESQLDKATGGTCSWLSSPTNTITYEAVTTGERGLQFAIPTSGSNFLGIKAISWKTQFGNTTPSTSNIALQAAYEDNDKDYVDVDYSTNVNGEIRTVNPGNYKFVRPRIVAAPSADATVSVSIRVD